MKRDVNKELLSLIACQSRTGVKKEDILLETKLIDDLGYDSLEMMQLIVDIENYFGIEFAASDMYLDNLNVYGNLLKYIQVELDKR